MRQKIEIMHVEQGEFCVKKFQIMRKNYALILIKNSLFFFSTYISSTFVIQKGEDLKKVNSY